VWIVQPDGSGAGPVLDYAAAGFALDHMPTWSPGGLEVAFCREFQGFSTTAALVVGDPSAVVSLVTAPSRGRSDMWPAWSPRGDVIAFWRNDGQRLQIWTIGADGNALTERAISAPNPAQNDYAPFPNWAP
jgi:Tol biopolymer transport system component